MRWLTLTPSLGLILGLCACGGASASAFMPGGTSAGSTGTSSGGTTGGGTTGGSNETASTGTSGQPQLGVTLHGDLAFPVLFAGEFYGALPDGGPDLSNLDCRISDGTDLGALCSGGPTPGPDDGGGLITSRRVLDIYVTSASADALTKGVAAVSMDYGDGGEFATIELTLCTDAGGWDFERASVGQVSYQASDTGMFGNFQARFPGHPDGGVLEGTFGAGYCGSLNGY